MIQWFPGHMAKAKKEIEANLRLVDIVFELVDARIPLSSKNPMINTVLQNKPKLMLMTKSNMADRLQTIEFSKYYEKENYAVLDIDSISGMNINKIGKKAGELLQDKFAREKAKGLKPRPIRAMIVGIPNVGKSTLINRLVKRKVAQVGDRPGVTKAQQWVRINQDLELLDTPGVLWPKFEDQKIGYHLAITGAIKDEVLHIEDIGEYLLDFLKTYYPTELTNRYQVNLSLSNYEIGKKIANDRGIFGEDFYERTLDAIINDFRSLKIGRITLDRLV